MPVRIRPKTAALAQQASDQARTTMHGDVSIHAFRGEGDLGRFVFVPVHTVSIHAFRGEGDTAYRAGRGSVGLFQSTPSGGKATPAPTAPAAASRFNPRLPGGRRLGTGQHLSPRLCFNPRLPGGRRRRRAPPRRGWSLRFNPRLPGGRRLCRAARVRMQRRFKSTPSGGKATGCGRVYA